MKQPLPIVWMSIATSVAVFAVVAVVMPPMEGVQPGMAIPIGLAGLLPAAGSLLVGRAVLLELPTQTRWIMRWALAEAVAIMGLMVDLTGGPIWFAAALMGLGMLLVLVQYPRET
ncbi:MAG: hypothetical protein H6735_09595 [Alphaproteobacteria bacterium]|nr:hypothetical protein [Alphaproteobacteria bacterium]